MTEPQLLTAIGSLGVLQYVPSMIAKLRIAGFVAMNGNRETTPILPEWANRADRAQRNMIDNLASFAVVLFAAKMAGAEEGAVLAGCTLFFWGRLVHAISYTAGITYVRSIAFVVSLVGIFTLAAAAISAP